jgi:hypothetical protein
MSDIKQTTKCNDCGAWLEELPGTPVEERKPCPSCGSLSRKVEVTIQDTVTVREKLGVKTRHGSTGKPFYEADSGDDLHRKTGKWMKLERVVDRLKNWYREVIINPKTNEVVHKCEEPLSEHKGHGSAKRRRGSEIDE